MFSGDYTTGRIVSRMLAFLGWIQVLFGALILILAISLQANRHTNQIDGIWLDLVSKIGLSWSLPIIVIGFLAVAYAHSTRATMDSAVYARQMLEIARAKINRSGPEGSDVAEASTGRLPKNTANNPPNRITNTSSLPSESGALNQDVDSWPRAVEEWEHRGRQGMTLEDGSLAVRTLAGWRRFDSFEEIDEFLQI